MTTDELKAAGESIYGEHWRRPLAEALNVDISTLRRWASGVTPVPGPVAIAIEQIKIMVNKNKQDGSL